MHQQLAYKTEWSGGQLIEVDPRGTSQMRSGCGHRDGDSRSGRRFHCVNCGLRMGADVNAAVNILRLGKARDGGQVRHGGQAGGTVRRRKPGEP